MTTYVLVPGAGGQAWYWHRVVPELERRGHEVIAVELPTGDETAGLSAYAETIVTAATGRGPVTLVAQSMAGFSAPLTVGRLPVDEIVLVNAMVPAPGETAGDWWDNTGQPAARRDAEAAAGRDPNAEFDLLEGFFHDVPAEVTAAAMAAEPDQADKPFGDPWPLDAWPDVPTRAVVSRGDRLFPPDFQRRVLADRLKIEPTVITGGHLVALSYPQELAAAISDS
ncbi:alpha/beta hydrolase [Actinoplanes bogorensis]|uniref:Alpha/beta hydrolase n=1 Tax=Paractinoplanes bogorensis TaxID=1610840 RepID=A0ABS5Z505_9ACTN|nr:alpha/beta hydrolase [Actinoplanes bogorensis]MBU2669510.1 alpha/beta hydrolase [Actinoplanes bogorensis]